MILRGCTRILGLLALTACTSVPATRVPVAEHPALGGPASPDLAAPSPFDATPTYRTDGSRLAAGAAPPVQPSAGAADPVVAAGYTCPMHAEVHATEPGDCPICGMMLVPIAEGGVR